MKSAADFRRNAYFGRECFQTQAGVGSNTRTTTVINGMRPSYSNLTLDGINFQDTVRLNDLDYLPNKFTVAQIAEFTVATSNASPTVGGAASTIAMRTPSGTNGVHGSAYWYNRNSYFASNDWFNNKNGIKRPHNNLNEIGGTFGGPIRKDKLFYFGNYEAYRLKRQTTINNTILLPDARNGILTYKSGGAVQKFDVLKAAGLSMSPTMQKLLAQVPTVGNNNSIGDGLNTTGYSFPARYNETRDNITAKVDYNMSTSNVFAGSLIWNRDIVDRPGYTPFYSFVPPIYNDNNAKLMSASWRWTPGATLTNELRGGFNLAPGTFVNRQTNPAYFITGMNFSSPVESSEVAEGRTVNTYVLQDNANWMHGRHTIQFGYQMTLQEQPLYLYNGVVPSYGVGVSAASPYGFSTQIPGATSTDYSRANALLASLAGLLSTGTQTFNPTSRTSGFVSGAPSRYDETDNQYAFYALDSFKLRRNLTLTMGLRWDYMAPVDETNGMAVMPLLIDNNVAAAALGNATLDFYGGSSGRRLYKRDFNNFAPNLALAWDPFGDGKTSVRAGYSISYLNDNLINSAYNVFAANSGIQQTVSIANLTQLADAPPSISTPAFLLPTTSYNNFKLSPSAPPSQAIMDPNLVTPYAQQWNLSIQREVRGFTLEGRYVANHVVKMLREIDMNQININQQGYLADFIRARNNGFAALSAGKSFNPAYDPNVPGSQQLTFLPTLPNKGNLNNATVQSYLRSGEVGTLAQTYQSQMPDPQMGFTFFPNPYTLYSAVMTNLSNSSYNSAQFVATRSLRNGMYLQANYTFSKVLTDALGQRGLDPQLDNNNPRIERARADFDLTHSFKLTHYIPLPFGPQRRFSSSNRILNKVAEGWAASGFLQILSGNPVSLLSGLGTLNRGARSGQNTVDTSLTKDQLKALTGKFMTGNGPYWFNPADINPSTGAAIQPYGSAAFAGQVMFTPEPGDLGSLQRRILDGPWFYNYNLSLSKETHITERQKIVFSADVYNLLNHANVRRQLDFPADDN